MKKIAALFSFTILSLAPQILAQDVSQKEREAGISFSYNATRSWRQSSVPSEKSDRTALGGTY